MAVACLSAGGLLAGCSGGLPGEDEPDEAQEALGEEAAGEQREGAKDRHAKGKFGQRGGPDRLIHMALREEIGLSDAQRATIEASLHDLKAGRERGPGKEGAASLAEAIRAGSVDAKAHAPKDMGATMQAHREKMARAFDVLHDTLTKEQRATLIATAKEKIESRDAAPARDGKKRGKHAKRGRDHGDFVGMVLRGVTLKDGQREKIDAALDAAGVGIERPEPPTKEHRAERIAAEKAFLDAFATDSFDAKRDLPAPPAKLAGGSPPFVEALAAIVPILDADQREQLASRIEKGPMGKAGKRGKRSHAK